MESETPPPLQVGVVPARVPMARPSLASRGEKIQLKTNHFRVGLSNNTKEDFYQYTVTITYEDGTLADSKNVGRRVLDELYKMYSSDFNGRYIAYDGDKSLFTIGSLPHQQLEFPVVIGQVASNRHEDECFGDNIPPKKRLRIQPKKRFNVALEYAAKIPIQSIALALRGQDSEHFQEAVRVLNVILQENAAKQGYLLVKQSFFPCEPRNFVRIGGGVVGCRGFHSSFRPTQGGLSLNIDVSTAMLVMPVNVLCFLYDNQCVNHPSAINWCQAEKALKNLRVKAINSNLEYKITGLSKETCGKQRKGDFEEELTVYEYFVFYRGINLRQFSRDSPCISVGKPKRPVYIPIELCELVSLQRYTRALSSAQKAALVKNSHQKPQEHMSWCETFCMRHYNADPLLLASGISINKELTTVEGRVLTPPTLVVGRNEKVIPCNGRWNFNNKTLMESTNIQRWCIVNFNSCCNLQHLSTGLIRCGEMLGIKINDPFVTIEESEELSNAPPVHRVDEMISCMKSRLPGSPQFILCALPKRKNSRLYGPWKKAILCDLGRVTQCIAPSSEINDQYLTNVLLKINAKMGGINSLLETELPRSIPVVSQVPTLIVGMYLSHGSARSNLPSIAAVVSSRKWPMISRYRAAVRTQSAKLNLIDNLFKKVHVTVCEGIITVDQGIFRELLIDFYQSSGSRPEHIIIFRDGVSESQFSPVLNVELDQIIEACKFLGADWFPKFTVVIAQKKHHTKFFQAGSQDNVPPGTVSDNGICHAKNNDFYMCAHAGMIGTTRPTHYQVLYDEIGFSADDVQELVHSLSYVYQRSTTAVSIVAPIYYARLAASQMSQFINLDDELPEQSSSHGGEMHAVPELPLLQEDVRNSMFFC